MKNYLIKLLGGVPKDDFLKAVEQYYLLKKKYDHLVATVPKKYL